MCGETASQFQVEPAGSPLLHARYAWKYFCGQLSRNSVLGSLRADVEQRGRLWGGPGSGTWVSKPGDKS